MNVTITQNPADFQPVKTDGLFFVVSADTQTVYKFRYVYDLYIEGIKVFTGKSTPNPEGLGVIDVSRVLNSYLQNSPVALYGSTPIFLHQSFPFSRPYTNEVLTYYIQVGEEHSTTADGEVLQYTGIDSALGEPSVPSLDFRTYLGTYPVNYIANTQSFNINPFILSGNPSTTQGLYLTNSPRQRVVAPDDYYTLSFTNYKITQTDLSEPYYVTYNFYDDNNTVITGYSFTNIYSNGGGPLSSCTQTYNGFVFPTGQRPSDYNILNVGAGPQNLPYIPSDAIYYTVQLFGKTPTPANPTPTPTPTQSYTPTPTPTPTFACICRSYTITNTSTEGLLTVDYLDCFSVAQQLVLGIGAGASICACQGTLVFSNLDYTISDQGSCSGCECVQLSFTNTSERAEYLSFRDCNNILNVLSIAGSGTFSACTCSTTSWTGATFTASTIGYCNPDPSPTPTPTASSTGVFNGVLRSCCDGISEIRARVSDRMNYGNTVAYNGVCYQLIASSSYYDIDLSSESVYTNCDICEQIYSCAATPEQISTNKPAVEPATHVPSLAGNGTCIYYYPVSEIFTFFIEENCGTQYGQLQLMFRNRFGTYDYYRFSKGKSEALGIERQTFKQFNQTWGQSNIIKTTYSRGTTDFATQMVETHIINSGFIPQSEMVYLQELYTSDDVYEVKPDGTLMPINVVNEEFIIKNKGNKSLVNLELTYNYSNNIRLLGR